MISAIILAAGESKRMGQPKMLLPWGKATVIEHVIAVFMNAGVEDILVVTGGSREEVEKNIESYKVRKIHNPNYASGEMLSSLQTGLAALNSQTQATLVGLGDQPQVREGSVRMVCEAFRATKSDIVVPSFQMRRGHPWLVARPLWSEITQMKPPQSLRDFLKAHASEIHYVNMDDPNILSDMDTPDDYQKSRP